MQFLREKDGVLSLKTLSQAKALGGNKRSLSSALSEFVRQAWSEYSFAALYSLYLTLVSKNNQAERARLPGKTSSKSQTNLLTLSFSWMTHSSTLIGCDWRNLNLIGTTGCHWLRLGHHFPSSAVMEAKMMGIVGVKRRMVPVGVKRRMVPVGVKRRVVLVLRMMRMKKASNLPPTLLPLLLMRESSFLVNVTPLQSVPDVSKAWY
jgi:hypothetical protein